MICHRCGKENGSINGCTNPYCGTDSVSTCCGADIERWSTCGGKDKCSKCGKFLIKGV